MELQCVEVLDAVAFNIGTLREAKKRFSERLAPDFSFFDYVRTDEMALSRCIAGLLDPLGTHGQGGIFLRSFIENMCPNATWIKTLDSCEVKLEKQANGQRRIDMHLSFEEGFIGIENKPWAADQKGQLFDYAEHLKTTAKKCSKEWLLIYLCNDEPSTESISIADRELLTNTGNLITINFPQLVTWLDICRSKTKALCVQVFIEELIKFIQIRINGELEMSEEKETCSVILSSKKKLESAFQVFKSIDGVKRELLIKFRSQLISEMDRLGFQLIWDNDLEVNWATWVGFGVKFRPEQDVYLRFEFSKSGLNGLEWGLRRDSEAVIQNSTRWKAIRELMSNSQFGVGKDTSWWPWYAADTKSGLGVEVRDWYRNDQPWALIMDDGENCLAKRVAKLATQVNEIFDSNPSLLC